MLLPTNVVTRNVGRNEAAPGGAAPPAGPDEKLVATLREEMAAAWRNGERPLAEEFLVRLPNLRSHLGPAIQLIHQEICLRQEFGEPLAAEAVVKRFPQWQAELQTALDQRPPRAVASGPPLFPGAGESLGDCQLLAELGQGALGRVFLANQASLADRPVVLKMTPCHGHEHLSLARLQHTHVVPLYWVQDYPARNLRVLCMPYLGGAALSDIVQRIRQPLGERHGSHLLAALEQVRAESPLQLPVAGPARHFLARASYAQAMCWLGACLAEALQYAHERGLVHLDLKPSNVLLAADGQPLLLDFHLARAPLAAGQSAPDRLGGTPLYMSPEQKAALAAVRSQGTLPATVDGRSDIYSLGVLLYEVLAGRLPDVEPAPLHRLNPQVSVGLSDIIQRCLAADARDRYPNAAALALDLCLHVKDQPLRGVRNRSWRERWAKWRRRKPHALAVWSLLLVAGAALLAVALLVRGHADQRRQQGEAALADGRQHLADRDYAEATRTLTRGLAQADAIPGGAELRRALAAELRRARRAQATQDLHTVAEQVRFLVDIDSLPPAERRSLETRCRLAWEARGLILDRAAGELPVDLERSLQLDLLDLAIIWADLNVRLAPAGSAAAARREALAVLGEAEKLFGPSAILSRERQVLGQGDAMTPSTATTPRTPWDHVALGRMLLRRGELEAAAAEIEQAVEEQPHSFWPNFYLGMIAYRRGELAEAEKAFSVCIALRPDSPACYVNRALARLGLGMADRARKDYDRALQLQPKSSAAALNRGILNYREKRLDEARADLQRALDSGADPATVYYNLALVHPDRNDRAAARTSVDQALRHHPEHRPSRDLREQLQRIRD